MRLFIFSLFIICSCCLQAQDTLSQKVLHRKVLNNWPKKKLIFKNVTNSEDKRWFDFDKKTNNLFSVRNSTKDTAYEFYFIYNDLTLSRFHVYGKSKRKPIQSGWYYFSNGRLIDTLGNAPTSHGEVQLLLTKSKELFTEAGILFKEHQN